MLWDWTDIWLIVVWQCHCRQTWTLPDFRPMRWVWRTVAGLILLAEIEIGGRPRGLGPQVILEILEADSLSSSSSLIDIFLLPAGVLSQVAGDSTVRDRLGPVRAPEPQDRRYPGVPVRPDHLDPVVHIAGSLIPGSVTERRELVLLVAVRATL